MTPLATRPTGSAHRPLVDWPSAVLGSLMAAGLPLTVVAYHVGAVGLAPAMVVATLLMNLSFTAWHEPAHGNFSRQRAVNHVMGILMSWVSVYPGYFARRREHLVHHRFEGQMGRDPVYPRIQSTFWGFPWRLFQVTLNPPPLDVDREFHALTAGQRWSDRVSNMAAAAVVVVSFATGWGLEVTALWIVPRVVVFWLHAYYICWLPHSAAGGGYVLYRVRTGRLAALLTVGQSLHGIHHCWPFVPWYQYASYLRRHSEEAQQRRSDTA